MEGDGDEREERQDEEDKWTQIKKRQMKTKRQMCASSDRP